MRDNHSLPQILERICQGDHLSQEEAYEQFSDFIKGKIGPIEISALLTALKAKGEVSDEILGALSVLKAYSKPFETDAKKQFQIVDCVGTGGDGYKTFNISTASSFVLAGLGVKVAKHGNRAVSSRCGSADLFESLGVNIEMEPTIAHKALLDIGLCFLYAPFYHPSIAKVRQVRSTLKIKTLFNLLGPLLNPLQPEYLLVGVYDAKYCELLAQVLQKSGAKRALVIHGCGLDEVALHGETIGYLLKDNSITPFRLRPSMVGLPIMPLSALQGGDVDYNTQACLDLLQGRGQTAYRNSVAINCACILWLVDKVSSIKEGVQMTQEIMSTAAAYEKLLALKELSHAK